jgi:hydroxyacylglutathione hydrolase
MIPLEDNFSDVIGKAQRGLRLSDTELAEKARVSSQKIRELREGKYRSGLSRYVAPGAETKARH